MLSVLASKCFAEKNEIGMDLTHGNRGGSTEKIYSRLWPFVADLYSINFVAELKPPSSVRKIDTP